MFFYMIYELNLEISNSWWWCIKPKQQIKWKKTYPCKMPVVVSNLHNMLINPSKWQINGRTLTQFLLLPPDALRVEESHVVSKIGYINMLIIILICLLFCVIQKIIICVTHTPVQSEILWPALSFGSIFDGPAPVNFHAGVYLFNHLYVWMFQNVLFPKWCRKNTIHSCMMIATKRYKEVF